MAAREWPLFLATVLWLLVMASTLASRPLLAVDETRYLAVAWEMWRDSHFLVPYLNGEAYSHKPPLLFWLINLGWAVFGVNDWWPRLAAPIFGLASLLMASRMAWRLWPQEKMVIGMAPLILFGSLFWTFFTTMTMFDMMLAFFAQVGLQGVLRAWRGDYLKGFAWLGLGLCLGVLTKGPAILLHVLPAALLAPLWGENRVIGWVRWYLGVAAAAVLALGLVLAWALPAANQGGLAYANAILWGQSAGRVVDSFAHGRPVWWYLAVVPLMALPWTAWPAMWKASLLLKASMRDFGIRFCLCWLLPSFLAFSLISGKQLHYLLPIFPALALIMAFLLAKEEKSLSLTAPGILFAVLGAVLVLLPLAGQALGAPSWSVLLHGWWGLPSLALGLGVIMAPPAPALARVAALAVLSAVLALSAQMGASKALAAAYDLKPLALRLAEWERQGYALAFFGKYHGQFHFMGRLQKRIEPIGLRNYDEQEWEQANPIGKVIAYYYNSVPAAAAPDLIYKFRDGYFVVWDKQTVLDHPGLARRD